MFPVFRNIRGIGLNKEYDLNMKNGNVKMQNFATFYAE